MNEAKIPVYYFGHIISVLQNADIDVDEWLKSQKLSMLDIMAVDASITNFQFEALVSSLLRDSSLENIGLAVGQRLQIAHHGFFGLGLANCKDLQQSLLFLKSFLPMRIPNIEIKLEQHVDSMQVVLIDQLWQDDMHRTVVDALITAILNVIHGYEFSNSQKVTALTLSLDYLKPSYAQCYASLPVETIKFSQTRCVLSIPNALLSNSIERVDQISFMQAELMCKKAVADNNVSPPLDYLVERVIEQEINNEIVSLDEVASRLHMSSRTLNRQLKMRNTSYKQIVDKVRKKIIIEYLLHKNMSVTQVAITLGYSDLANFRRAFKRIFKQTPQQFLQDNR